jgi:hypothetical protein
MIIYTFILVTCLIIGLVSAGIAKQKGKDPIKWFLIGCILNIIAIITIVFAEKKHN